MALGLLVYDLFTATKATADFPPARAAPLCGPRKNGGADLAVNGLFGWSAKCATPQDLDGFATTGPLMFTLPNL